MSYLAKSEYKEIPVTEDSDNRSEEPLESLLLIIKWSCWYVPASLLCPLRSRKVQNKIHTPGTWSYGRKKSTPFLSHFQAWDCTFLARGCKAGIGKAFTGKNSILWLCNAHQCVALSQINTGYLALGVNVKFNSVGQDGPVLVCRSALGCCHLNGYTIDCPSQCGWSLTHIQQHKI